MLCSIIPAALWEEEMGEAYRCEDGDEGQQKNEAARLSANLWES